MERFGIQQPFDARARVPQQLVSLGWQRPWRTLLAWFAVVLVASPGVFRLHVETSTNSVLDRSSPEWSFYQASQSWFGGDEVLTVLFEGEDPLEPELLERVARTSRSLAQIPGIHRVDSLSTVPNVRALPNGSVSLDPILDGSKPILDQELDALSERIREDRIARRLFVSDDLRAFGVNAILEQGSEARYAQILGAVQKEVSAANANAWLSGVPVFRVAADERTRGEIVRLIPLTVLLIGALLFVIFRSLRAIWIPLGTTAIGVWVVMGAMGVLGTPVTITTVTLPSILLALGCAYCIHLLNAASTSAEGDVEASLRGVALPVMLSGLTTAVGFVAMSLVRIDAIRQIGSFGALGVLIIVLSSLTAAPAVIRLRPLPLAAPRGHESLRRALSSRIVAVTSQRRGLIFSGWIVVAVLTFVGFLSLRVETDVIVWFQKSDPIRIAYEEIRSRLVGISPINVVIAADDAESVSASEAIAGLDGLAEHMESMPEVGRAISIADPLRQLHGGFVQDPANPLPEDRAAIEQYLLLLEGKEYANDLISPDRRRANLVLRVDDNGSKSLLRVAGEAERWWEEHGPPGYSAKATGIMFEFARAQDEIAWGQARGLGFALGAVAMILFLVFRSVRLAVIALVPNVIPIAMMFGVMGLADYPIDAATVILGSLALGIAVDDTIHVAEGFARRSALGLSPETALLETLGQVVAPLVYATLAVTLGFGVLLVSGFAPIQNLGAITGGVMLVCLLADVLLLPALLLWKGGGATRKPS